METPPVAGVAFLLFLLLLVLASITITLCHGPGGVCADRSELADPSGARGIGLLAAGRTCCFPLLSRSIIFLGSGSLVWSAKRTFS